MRKDPLGLAIRVGFYAVLYFAIGFALDPPLRWVGGEFAGATAAVFLSAVFAGWLTLRIYENRPLVDLGLWLNRASADNLLFGLAGGAGAACLVLAPPLATGAAHLARLHPASVSGVLFTIFFLAVGSAGEELFFRGYGFQLLLARLGPYATIVPVAVVFGLLHSANPNATWLGVANTAGFGIVFGYAYLRSRDLWLPIGLHFGWNFTLPLFGASLSGIRMITEVTGHEMMWTAGKLWSGGEYGPEASVLTSGVMILLFAYIWKAPVRRQPSPLTDPPAESAACEPSSPSPL
ncbi:MAG: CPBP family intramembrane metalloprotease [Acidobacteriia bacterium]|nr:CPBP family intramembrane metalloprotease [Terriglobia bacterium]